METREPTNEEIRKSRLAHVRKRIALVESALENPDSIINIALDGVSEQWIPRETLVRELTELYAQEDRLRGSGGRIRYADTSRLTGF
ncbi:MAG: hypothetical protein IKE69_08080 [Thermoguttaceae bacterium]|nr:hypothetical protein [Thermoguttaceae bacterium]